MNLLCYLDGTLCEKVPFSNVLCITLDKVHGRFLVLVKTSNPDYRYRDLICSDLELEED